MDLPHLAVARERASSLDKDLQLPLPESHSKFYSQPRLNRAISYAKERMSRNTTPRTQKILELYLAACRAALDELTSNDQGTFHQLFEEIREYETQISQRLWLSAIPNSQQSKLESDLLELRRLTLYRRYGDYTAQIAKNLRFATVDRDHEILSGSQLWTQISRRLRDEESYWNLYGSRQPDTTPTTFAIYDTCVHVGMDYTNMIHIVHLYAERNDAFHLGF